MEHSFNVEIATKYGINEAIIINYMNFWVQKNKANEINFYNGTYWTFNSNKAFKKLFPYMSEKQISYALKKLKEEGIIQVGNFNKSAYDRTLWYAFTKKGNSILQNSIMEDTNLANGNGDFVEPIPVNNTVKENNKDNKLSLLKEKTKKQDFIPPTVEEIRQYCRERNNNVDAQQFFDYYNSNDWKDNQGKQVKSWKQKIIANWEKNNTQNTNQNNTQNTGGYHYELINGYNTLIWD